MKQYKTQIPAGSHWSLKVKRGTTMKLTDIKGNANVGMLFYNPENLLERYNAPDTLKCQYTFKLTKGNCLYSDMGRIFCSIIDDGIGWHETVCGNSNAEMVSEKWQKRDYQKDKNDWHQNGNDAFLVELAKFGLNRSDMSANVNWFSKVVANEKGTLALEPNNSNPMSSITLRFEMDTLVMLHTCPHPLLEADSYPNNEIEISLGIADAVQEDDYCRNFRPENLRGFANNELYHFGMGET